MLSNFVLLVYSAVDWCQCCVAHGPSIRMLLHANNYICPLKIFSYNGTASVPEPYGSWIVSWHCCSQHGAVEKSLETSEGHMVMPDYART